jgi:hypothetical protein
MKTEIIGAILSIVAGVITTIGLYIKQKTQEKTGMERYEERRKQIDEAISRHDIGLNDAIIDDLLPPDDPNSTGRGLQSK